ncbi:hypothetical protein AB4Y30_08430 [Ornithinibacillus sp. 4-3]|uniref:Nudix hydrolase domain-containing protein n=1 Tax=Ornithinibacillus sp. 4-3 TaxID=3231488 RepID=A0AB39HVN4_9BACI
MKKGEIRTLAIFVFKNDSLILVAKSFDKVNEDYYGRPIGEGIEYRETFKLLWKSIDDFKNNKLRLVPEKLFDLLRDPN